MATSPVLPRLLGEQSVSSFLRDTYLRFPHHALSGAGDLIEPLTPEELVAEILGHRTLDVVVGREGQLNARPVELDLGAARDFLADGQTIGIRHVDRTHLKLAELSENLSRELGAPVDMHLYWTPAGNPGFGWHFDAEEVFVVQLLGSKIWRLRMNTVFPWPVLENLPTDQRYEREVMPVRTYRLETAGWLYIPSGYWHATEADQESLSLSIGLRAPVALDLLDALRESLVDSIEWRERLPCHGTAADYSRAELDAVYAELLQRLTGSLTAAMNGPYLRQRLIDGAFRGPSVPVDDA